MEITRELALVLSLCVLLSHGGYILHNLLYMAYILSYHLRRRRTVRTLQRCSSSEKRDYVYHTQTTFGRLVGGILVFGLYCFDGFDCFVEGEYWGFVWGG